MKAYLYNFEFYLVVKQVNKIYYIVQINEKTMYLSYYSTTYIDNDPKYNYKREVAVGLVLNTLFDGIFNNKFRMSKFLMVHLSKEE